MTAVRIQLWIPLRWLHCKVPANQAHALAQNLLSFSGSVSSTTLGLGACMSCSNRVLMCVLCKCVLCVHAGIVSRPTHSS